jgi:hypothetical protein
MPLPSIVLWADSNKNEFVTDWQSNNSIRNMTFRQGDTVGIELHWVEQPVGQPMKEVVWPDAVNVTMAIGKLDSSPLGGTFKLSFGGEHTADLPFNATAAQIQTALNGLTPIVAEGGVVVIKNNTTYRINWVVPGVISNSLTVYSNDLTPTCTIGVAVARPGTSSAGHIVQMHIKQAPVAVCTSWTPSTDPIATVTQTHAPAYSGDHRVWRLVINPAPRTGTLRISKVINGTTYWTTPIGVEQLSEQAIAIATGLYCIKVSDVEYEIYQTQLDSDPTVNVSVLSADSSGLIGFSSIYGQLNLNSLDVELLLNGAASAQAIVEIEVEMDGKRQTLVQSDCIVMNDLIDTDAYTLQQWGDVIPADSVVRYDTAQSLSDPQKSQARTNIGAIGTTSLVPYTTKDNELEARIASLESGNLTGDIKDALTGAATPSATNVFATENELAGKAPLVHSHAISDVTGLATALANKADASHAHVFADITGLNDALNALNSGKADINHTHVIADITNLQATLNNKSDVGHTHDGLLNTDQKDAVTYATSPSASNPFATESWVTDNAMTKNPPVTGTGITGAYNNTNYPYEIEITINGTTYKVPARI